MGCRGERPTVLAVTNFFSNNVSVIDTLTNTIVATMAVTGDSGGGQPWPERGPDRGPNQFDGSVSVINTITNTVIGTVTVVVPRSASR